jgi:hypothetical protein
MIKNNSLKIFAVLLVFSVVGCKSYQPFLAMKTLDGYDLRVEKLDDKACRCSTVFIDVRKNVDLEVRYKMQCVLGDDPIITKEKRFLKNGKIERLITYKSDTKITDLSLTSLDSVALYKIPKITDLDFKDCKRLEAALGSINGFTKASEYMGKRKFKKLMDKKIKM